MRKFLTVLLVAAICATGLFAMLAVAGGGIPTTETVTMAPATGLGVWTNAAMYDARQLVSIEVFNNSSATGVVTVTRLRGTAPVRTNSVCTITCAAGAGVYREITNSIYFFNGDTLDFANADGAGSASVTGATAEVTFIIPK
jgi:hypothetical protein